MVVLVVRGTRRMDKAQLLLLERASIDMMVSELES